MARSPFVWQEVDRILDEYLEEIGEDIANADDAEQIEDLQARHEIVEDVLKMYRAEFT